MLPGIVGVARRLPWIAAAGLAVMLESMTRSKTDGTVALCAALFTLIIALPALRKKREENG